MSAENPHRHTERKGNKKDTQRPEQSRSPVTELFVKRIRDRLYRKPEGKNELPPEETAKLLRERQLDMMNYGVLGSGKEIPEGENPDTIQLPHLLQYSPTIRRHYDTFKGILHRPTTFDVTTNANTLYEKTTQGDVLYEPDGPNHIYYLGNEITDPFIHPWIAAQGENPMLFVSIMQHNRDMDGMWSVDYSFWATTETSPDNISTSEFYPERSMVLDFWFSPKPLEGKEILKKMRSFSDDSKKHTFYQGEAKRDGFRRFLFYTDGNAFADEIEKHKSKTMNHEEEVALLRRKGDIDFSVVEIGTVDIGGQKHWVYTGSEHAQVAQKKQQPGFLGQLRTAFEPGQ